MNPQELSAGWRREHGRLGPQQLTENAFLTPQIHTLEEEMFSIWRGWLMSIGQHGVRAKLYEEIVQYVSPTQVSAVFPEQSLPHSSHFGRKLKDNSWKAVESPSHTGNLDTEKQPYTFGGFFLSNFFFFFATQAVHLPFSHNKILIRNHLFKEKTKPIK